MQTVKPIGDRLLVRPIEDTNTFEGTNFYKPDIAKEKPAEGIVEAIGDGLAYKGKDGRLKMDVNVGNAVYTIEAIPLSARVLYGVFSGTDIRVNGKELKIIRLDEVLGLVEGQPEPKVREVSSEERLKHLRTVAAGTSKN